MLCRVSTYRCSDGLALAQLCSTGLVLRFGILQLRLKFLAAPDQVLFSGSCFLQRLLEAAMLLLDFSKIRQRLCQLLFQVFSLRLQLLCGLQGR